MVGMTATGVSADLAANPSARINHICFGKDTNDTTWQLMTNDGVGAATKTNTGVTMAAGDIIDLFMFAPPGTLEVTVSARRVNDGTILVDNQVISSDLPATNTLLYPIAQARSATATNIVFALNRIYLETDI